MQMVVLQRDTCRKRACRGGLVTILARGDVGAVKAATDAGAAAAESRRNVSIQKIQDLNMKLKTFFQNLRHL